MNLVEVLFNLPYTNQEAIKRALKDSKLTKEEILAIYQKSFSKNDFINAINYHTGSCPDAFGIETSDCILTHSIKDCETCWKKAIEKELGYE